MIYLRSFECFNSLNARLGSTVMVIEYGKV